MQMVGSRTGPLTPLRCRRGSAEMGFSAQPLDANRCGHNRDMLNQSRVIRPCLYSEVIMSSEPLSSTVSAGPRLHIERMMHRQAIAVPGESAAAYALLKLIPSLGSPAVTSGSVSLPLDLALVLDISGSMYEEDGTSRSRLQRIQDAAIAALGKLRPTDRVAVIAFGHDAHTLLPLTPLSDKARLEEVIRRIDMFSVDQAGTAMHQGLTLALDAIGHATGENRVGQVVVLTDGETEGEAVCRELAAQAAQHDVRLSLMGVGTEWNSSLIKGLAEINDGRWYYIDAEKPDEATRVFLAEFDRLADTAFRDVEVKVRPAKDVRVKRIRQVVPEIQEIPLLPIEERLLTASLGHLEGTSSRRYVVDMSLPRRPDGTYVVAQVEVTYRTATAEATTGLVSLEVTYAPQPGYVNAEVARHIDEVQIFEMNANLQAAIGSDNPDEARRVAEQIAKKGELLGARGAKKTMLARQVLEELNTGGRVSRKTQLAVDDVARLAEEIE